MSKRSNKYTMHIWYLLMITRELKENANIYSQMILVSKIPSITAIGNRKIMIRHFMDEQNIKCSRISIS